MRPAGSFNSSRRSEPSALATAIRPWRPLRYTRARRCSSGETAACQALRSPMPADRSGRHTDQPQGRPFDRRKGVHAVHEECALPGQVREDVAEGEGNGDLARFATGEGGLVVLRHALAGLRVVDAGAIAGPARVGGCAQAPRHCPGAEDPWGPGGCHAKKAAAAATTTATPTPTARGKGRCHREAPPALPRPRASLEAPASLPCCSRSRSTSSSPAPLVAKLGSLSIAFAITDSRPAGTSAFTRLAGSGASCRIASVSDAPLRSP